ncbi:putative receptor-like protein kinase At4g00960 isoform X2 [Papaver somniferum]|uniref:putative receptor-like protein kinase At4g00960 isoform X2 n=1 Tax=Papaver somniferum TaxID=3469 RepID=UPI000E6FA81C|nr:putative receptor-like protein kinase At4g00960 isoform X2 [Papaver somniferum]
MVTRNKKIGNGSIFFIYLFLLSILLITIQDTTAQPQPDFVYKFCLGDNYTTGSTFQANLNRLFPSSIQNRYYNATNGQSPDNVYGSLQCRGDIQQDECQSCVDFAIQDFNKTGRCPNSKQAIIWYEKCELMNDLAGKAGSSFSTNFASGNRSFDDFQRAYGLVECTPDISSGSCNRCLSGAISDIPNCCDGKQGGRVIRPSCNIRYELYTFFESTVIPPPPPPLPSPTPPSSTNAPVPNENRNNSSKLTISIVVPLVVAVLLALALGFFCFQRKRTQKNKYSYVDDETPVSTAESLHFNFSTISAATNNFSEANKLGEGGFGSVYKGTLPDGRQIAVKRLSKYSGQGDLEFKNEVTLVAKLQHRNLVQLIGFSLAGEEKLLIYEFMPNASLDQFLFDPVKCTQLDWERRYKIIAGVARGLVYLHEESRLKIIHRDLKASNILLDMDMNSKIADFGMARIFVHDQTQERTSKIVGTYGYMAPEYIMHGHFSVKSDVFSFGVLILEILCGQKNSSFHQSSIAQDLLSYVWRHWNNGSAIEILDPTLKDTCSRSEVMRCIHVALLCVQEDVADRPTMPTVIQMLYSYSATDPALPSAPAFFIGSTVNMEPQSNLVYSEEQGSSKNESVVSEVAMGSVNEVTITELDPR